MSVPQLKGRCRKQRSAATPQLAASWHIQSDCHCLALGSLRVQDEQFQPVGRLSPYPCVFTSTDTHTRQGRSYHTGRDLQQAAPKGRSHCVPHTCEPGGTMTPSTLYTEAK